MRDISSHFSLLKPLNKLFKVGSIEETVLIGVTSLEDGTNLSNTLKFALLHPHLFVFHSAHHVLIIGRKTLEPLRSGLNHLFKVLSISL